jgi:phosphatidylglycerol:prolipoprotein diacylglycerol transferase
VLLHSLFDLLALLTGVAIYIWLPVPASVSAPREPFKLDRAYPLALALGGLIGAYLFGTLNAWLSGETGFGRSIVGALAGAIFGIEILKWRRGIVGSTGWRFAAPMAGAIAVGRIGCFLSGLNDLTHGTPTSLPWGHDFGDGIARHPVQLYESLAMAAFAAAYVWTFRTGSRTIVERGFYLCVGFYGAQRFVWEFLKPYGAVLGPFTIFHLLSAFLIVYAIVMLASNPHEMERERTARHSLGP